MNDLNQLPSPPQGVTGISPDRFSHLPPPPQGAQGMTLEQVKQAHSQLPLLTNPQGGVGTALKDEGVGFLKSAVRGVQGLGKSFLGSIMSNPTPDGTGNFDTSTIGIPDTTLASKSRGEQIGGALETGAEIASGFSGGNAEALITKGKGLLNTVRGAKAVTGTIEDSSRLAEMISPKPTNTQAKLAQSEGRLIKGKEPSLFRSGTPDTVIPSDKVKAATETILNRIPEVRTMNPQEVYSAVDNNIKTTAKNLRPQMDATPIKPETVEKINTDWERLKSAQMSDAPATEEPNVLKRQLKFEEFLKKSGNENQGHLWDTRIAYDESIPDAVKKATTESSESLQLQKKEWLQNRDILNAAINDTKLGMGKTSQKAFSDMSDMYEAKTNLQSKAKIETKVKPSKVGQYIKANPVKSAIGGYVGGKIYENTGLPGSNLLRNILP